MEFAYPDEELVRATATIEDKLPVDGCSFPVTIDEVRYAPDEASLQLVHELLGPQGAITATASSSTGRAFDPRSISRTSAPSGRRLRRCPNPRSSYRSPQPAQRPVVLVAAGSDDQLRRDQQWARHRMTNAALEGNNSRVRAISQRAHGYRNPNDLMLVLHHASWR